MTVSAIHVIIGRIAVATVASPIAVFCNENGSLDAIFAATITGQRRVRTSRGFVGVFDQSQDRTEVFKILHAAKRQAHKAARLQ